MLETLCKCLKRCVNIKTLYEYLNQCMFALLEMLCEYQKRFANIQNVVKISELFLKFVQISVKLCKYQKRCLKSSNVMRTLETLCEYLKLFTETLKNLELTSFNYFFQP